MALENDTKELSDEWIWESIKKEFTKEDRTP